MFNATLDVITNQLAERIRAMNNIVDAFNAIQPDTLAMLTDDALEAEANSFVESFKETYHQHSKIYKDFHIFLCLLLLVSEILKF